MKIVSEISFEELKKNSQEFFISMVKAVVDLERGLMAVDAEMHSDLEEFLFDDGSEQKNLWGINLHYGNFGKENFVEFDSMINIRPVHNNHSRYIEDEKIRQQITALVAKIVKV